VAHKIEEKSILNRALQKGITIWGKGRCVDLPISLHEAIVEGGA